MASERQTGEPRKGGDEQDAFSQYARRIHSGFRRAGAAKSAKQSFNRRVRRSSRVALTVEIDN